MNRNENRLWQVKPGRAVYDRFGRMKAGPGQTLPFNDEDARRARSAVALVFVDDPAPPVRIEAEKFVPLPTPIEDESESDDEYRGLWPR